MRVEFAASVAKEPAADEFNEDRFLFGLQGTIAALSDGASESFDSRSWATILCGLAASGSGVHPESVTECVRQYNSIYDLPNLSWSKAAAFERGSFATLLSVRHNLERAEAEIFGIGDSVIVLCQSGVVTRTFPLLTADEFEQRPLLLSTRNEHNDFLSDPLFNTKHVAVHPVSLETTALLLTDAIGHWCYRALEDGRDDWRFLLSVDSAEVFHGFVIAARADGRMKLDDTTLVRLSF